jgi:hypothetical protein
MLVAGLLHVRRGSNLFTRMLVSYLFFGTTTAWIAASLPYALHAMATGRLPSPNLHAPLEGFVILVMMGAVFAAPIALVSWIWARIRNAMPPEVPVVMAGVLAIWAWATRGTGSWIGLPIWTMGNMVGAYAAWYLVEGIERHRAGDRIGPPPGLRSFYDVIVGLAKRNTVAVGIPLPDAIETEKTETAVPDDRLEIALTQARERGRVLVGEILAAPDMLTEEAFAARLGCPTHHLASLARTGHVLRLIGKDGTVRYPEWQLGGDGRPLDGIAEVTAVLASPWAVYRFLRQIQPGVDMTGLEVLKTGRPEDARDLALAIVEGAFT